VRVKLGGEGRFGGGWGGGFGWMREWFVEIRSLL
jgi:hypothetical protein